MTAPDPKRVEVVARALCAEYNCQPHRRWSAAAYVSAFLPAAETVITALDAHDRQQGGGDG